MAIAKNRPLTIPWLETEILNISPLSGETRAPILCILEMIDCKMFVKRVCILYNSHPHTSHPYPCPHPQATPPPTTTSPPPPPSCNMAQLFEILLIVYEVLFPPRGQNSWGQHGAHLGSVGPRWDPCRPHEPCYQGLHPQCHSCW